MIKKKALNRIFISSIAIFIVFTFVSLNLIKEDKNIYKITDYTSAKKEFIYTLNEDNYVSKGYIYVSKDLTSLEKVKTLIDTMIEKNNKNALLPSYFKPILPQNTKVLSAELENKIIKINFSSEFLNVSDSQLEKMVEAITYTLTEIDDINGVEIYVEGELLKYVSNMKNIPTILTKDIGINKKYEITSNNNISKIVLYFLGENDNLIPITKYVNDEREKIEIIVESLSNNYIFYDNLISVLSYNLKLEDYEICDDTLTLVFNDFIYDNLEEKTVNENLIDIISYSIFDNYDVSKVIFMENNNKISEKLRKNLE
ncbi:MAG: GerMN domain-containing protein [bacterium]|nr:GerMN domain-containing protein [bacterium]